MAVKSSAAITLSCVVDVVATTRYYLLQSSTLSPPAKPSARQPGGSWTDSEPSYTATSTNSLYFVDRTDFSDGTWAYSSVSLSSSYEAAKLAYNKATAAQDAAQKALSNVELIVGEQTAATAAWTGHANFDTLVDKQQISYWLPVASKANATLQLSLASGATTAAVPLYYGGTTRIGTQYAAGNVIRLVYRTDVTIGTTTIAEGWWADANYDTNTSYALRMYNAIKAKTAITAGFLIVSDEEGYYHLGPGVSFDVNTPILYAGSTLAAAATGTNNYLSNYSINLRTTIGDTTWETQANRTIYLAGRLEGCTFTVADTDWLTETPDDETGRVVYISLGYMGSAYQMYLYPEHPMFRVIGGVLTSINQIAYQAMISDTIYGREKGYTIELSNCIDAPITDMIIYGNANQYIGPNYNEFYFSGPKSGTQYNFHWTTNGSEIHVSGKYTSAAVYLDLTPKTDTYLLKLFQNHIGQHCHISLGILGSGNATFYLYGYKSSSINLTQSRQISFIVNTPYSTPYMRLYVPKSTSISRTYRVLIEFGSSDHEYTPYTELPIPNMKLRSAVSRAGSGGDIQYIINDKWCHLPWKARIPGLPVASGGTYEDTNGQQWIADTLCLKEKKYVQRIGKRVLTGEEGWTMVSHGSNYTFQCVLDDVAVSGGADNVPALCTYLREASPDVVYNGTDDEVFSIGSNLYTEGNVLMVCAQSYATLTAFMSALRANQPELYYPLAVPVESEVPLNVIEEFNRLQTTAPNTEIVSMGIPKPFLEVEYLHNVAGAEGIIAARVAKLEAQEGTDALRQDTFTAMQEIDNDIVALGTELNQTKEALEARVLRSDMETYIRYSIIDNHGTVEIGQRDSTSESAYKTQTDNEGFRVMQSGNAMVEIRKNSVVTPVMEARRMIRLGDHTIKLSSTGHLNFC